MNQQFGSHNLQEIHTITIIHMLQMRKLNLWHLRRMLVIQYIVKQGYEPGSVSPEAVLNLQATNCTGNR